MLDLNRVLKNANLYSIEYAGFFSFKFSLSNELSFFKELDCVVIEFVSGCNILDSKETLLETKNVVFDLFGANISHVRLLEENQLDVEMDNGYKIISVNDENELIDRNWVLKNAEKYDSYILNDSGKLFYSKDMKELFG
jgi:hypothetical protein